MDFKIPNDEKISHNSANSKKSKCLINEHLEKFQLEMATGFSDCNHTYSQNGTISCIKCGITKNIGSL